MGRKEQIQAATALFFASLVAACGGGEKEETPGVTIEPMDTKAPTALPSRTPTLQPTQESTVEPTPIPTGTYTPEPTTTLTPAPEPTIVEETQLTATPEAESSLTQRQHLEQLVNLYEKGENISLEDVPVDMLFKIEPVVGDELVYGAVIEPEGEDEGDFRLVLDNADCILRENRQQLLGTEVEEGFSFNLLAPVTAWRPRGISIGVEATKLAPIGEAPQVRVNGVHIDGETIECPHEGIGDTAGETGERALELGREVLEQIIEYIQEQE